MSVTYSVTLYAASISAIVEESSKGVSKPNRRLLSIWNGINAFCRFGDIDILEYNHGLSVQTEQKMLDYYLRLVDINEFGARLCYLHD